MNDLYWWMGFILFWAIAIAWAAFSMFVGCLSIVYAIPRLEYFMRANWSLLTRRSRIFKWDIEMALRQERDQWVPAHTPPEYVWLLRREDNNNLRDHMLGITRRRRHMALVEAIRQAYFTKNN